MQRRVRYLIVIGLVFTVFSGCTTDKQKPIELSVFAAISLSDALAEIGTAFTAENGVKVSYNFAASTTLQRQIEKGAPADVFISASPRQIIALEASGLLEAESHRNLLTNRLVVVADETERISVETPADLAAPEISRIAIGHPSIVPAGAYAEEALRHFGVWETLRPKLIFGVDVRATLAYVTSGNVDVAIVYKTDTILSDTIRVIYQMPSETHTPIIYPVVAIKDSRQKQWARQFITYLQSAEKSEIFEKHGFTVLALK